MRTRSVRLACPSWETVNEDASSRGPSKAENLFESSQTRSVLFRSSNRNSDPFGQLVAGHRTNDNSQRLHLAENTLPIPNLDQNKIGIRGDTLQSKSVERALKILQPHAVVPKC